MSGYGDAFIGLDTSKAKNAVAIAEDGRGGEVRYLGEFENTAPATRKLVSRLAETYDHLHSDVRFQELRARKDSPLLIKGAD